MRSWVAFFIGVSGLLVQVFLLRLFLVVASGNELSVAVVSASFLFAEAAGAFLGCLVRTREAARTALGFSMLVFGLSLPLALLGAASSRDLLGLLPGEVIPLSMLFPLSLVLSFLPALTHGAGFTLLCRFCAEGSTTPGLVYAWEAAGTVAGGVLFASVLSRMAHEGLVVVLIFELGTVALVPLVRDAGRGFLVSFALCAVALVALVCVKDPLFTRAMERLFPGTVLLYRHSPYGNVAVSEAGAQRTLFANGVPLAVYPEGDRFAVEETVHLPLLLHPRPERVLVASGGLGGVLSEVLRHPGVKGCDYVELDPAVIAAARRFFWPEELSDPRLTVHPTDARLFLREARGSYDLIYLGLGEIGSFQVNRLFSKEFFEIVRARLSEGGIVALSFGSAFPYLPSEEREKLAVVASTLKAVFAGTLFLPGERFIMLASVMEGWPKADLAAVLARMNERGLVLSAVHPAQFGLRLRPVLALPELPRGEVNSDLHPRAFLTEMRLWCARFSPRFGRLLALADDLPLGHWFLAALLAAGAPALLARREGGVVCLITAAGFAGMVLEMLILLGFQVAAGALYGRLALLLSLFMAGSAAGAVLGARLGGGIRGLACAGAGLCIFLLVLPRALCVSVAPVPWFGTLSLLAGGLVGLPYPLAVAAVGAERAGVLYGADLLGGFLGGVLGSTVLIAVKGVVGASYVTAALVAAAALPLLFRKGQG